MSDFRPLILQIWKTAGQKSRLEDGVAALLQLLRQSLAVSGIVIGRFHAKLEYVETLSRVFADGSRDNIHLDDCPVGETHVFLQNQPMIYCRENDVPEILIDLADDGEKKHFLYWPVTQTEDVATFFLLVSGTSLPWNEDFGVLCREMSELILVMLQKETQHRNFVQQREAVEAEKQAVLQKLGRKNVIEDAIGRNNGLKQVFDRIDLISLSDTSVILFGENGTGKELIARTIHLRSARSERPFYRFNCGADSPEMMLRHLFGQEYQDGQEIIQGVLEKTDGGTLFLDDVHELTLSAQERLCDFLEKGEFKRYGGEAFQPVDVRLITATDHDLQQLVSASRFGERLWYRLTVFPVRIPALRERESDMKELADHFARRAATRFGLPLVLPNEEDLHLLKNYSWPGNVRELGTVMDRAAILGNGRKLEIASALGLHHSRIDRNPSRRENAQNRWRMFETIEPLDDMLKRYFEYVLDITQGKIEGQDGAATLLGVHPNTLRARMRKLGIDWKSFSSRFQGQ